MLSGSDFDCPGEMLFILYSSNILHTYVNCNSPVQTDSANRLHYAKQLGWNISIFSPHWHQRPKEIICPLFLGSAPIFTNESPTTVFEQEILCFALKS